VMEGQLKEMHDQTAFLRSQLQARMSLTFQQREDKSRNVWVITPHWRNVGNTEARNVSGWVAVANADKDIPPEYDFKMPPNKTLPQGVAATIPPSTDTHQEELPLPFEVAQSALKGSDKVYIWGEIKFSDIFAAEHHVYYCYLAIPNAGKDG